MFQRSSPQRGCLGLKIFPEFVSRWSGRLDSPDLERVPSEQDILIMGMHGPCFGALWEDKVKEFPGRVLFVNGEPWGDDMPQILALNGRPVGQDV